MPRPKITLHILSSLDGRITGSFEQCVDAAASDAFKRIGFEQGPDAVFDFQGWIYGTVTSSSYFAKGEPDIRPDAAPVSAGDFLTNMDAPCYYIAFDRAGKLGWQSNQTAYAGHPATVLEVLTQQASNGYKDFLRRLDIPYIIAGESDIDIPLALEKLSSLFHLSNLLLGGGGVLNWSFVQAGLCDEISIIVTPAIDGEPDSARLFNASFAGNPRPIGFSLQSVQTLPGDALWVRYMLRGLGGIA
ncbi:5-amino-6-(5-phosphoribosylamino)uracil reductase [Bombiscardovia nodaiensis]|uniref:5-amino-6-(5-phosphoribosylamino)uracil reductase n=1 Tax=Bombiscardovia nodaiensis TaxID=2932181 RepID=A0ABN6SAR0_9BIFI|nr:5-amino-6-(5-phosphoribosylamino)uracil reductase [Bombiscardovia nodaiensis]